ALWRRDRDDDRHTRALRMALACKLAIKLEKLALRRDLLGAQVVQKSGREAFLDEREILDRAAVVERRTDQRPNADVLISLEGGFQTRAVDAGSRQEIIDHQRCAGAQRLDGADHGAQIRLLRRELRREARAHMMHPQLERAILDPDFMKVLVGMKMAVDQSGDEQASGQLDHLVAGLRARGLDGADAIVLEQKIDRLRRDVQLASDERASAAQHGTFGHELLQVEAIPYPLTRHSAGPCPFAGPSMNGLRRTLLSPRLPGIIQ